MESQIKFNGYPLYQRIWHSFMIIGEPLLELYDFISDVTFLAWISNFYEDKDYPLFFPLDLWVCIVIVIFDIVIFTSETLPFIICNKNPFKKESVEQIKKTFSNEELWEWSCWHNIRIHHKIAKNKEITQEDMDIRRGPCTGFSSGRHGFLLWAEDVPQIIVVIYVMISFHVHDFEVIQKLIVGIISGILKAKTWIYG